MRNLIRQGIYGFQAVPNAILLLFFSWSLFLGAVVSGQVAALSLSNEQLRKLQKPFEKKVEEDEADGQGTQNVGRQRDIDPLKNSVILVSGGEWTFVPKESVIHIHESLESKVREKPEGKFSRWENFAKKNRSWLWTHEVTMQQATGESEIASSIIDRFTIRPLVVVATLKGGPITLKSPENRNP